MKMCFISLNLVLIRPFDVKAFAGGLGLKRKQTATRKWPTSGNGLGNTILHDHGKVRELKYA